MRSSSACRDRPPERSWPHRTPTSTGGWGSRQRRRRRTKIIWKRWEQKTNHLPFNSVPKSYTCFANKTRTPDKYKMKLTCLAAAKSTSQPLQSRMTYDTKCFRTTSKRNLRWGKSKNKTVLRSLDDLESNSSIVLWLRAITRLFHVNINA